MGSRSRIHASNKGRHNVDGFDGYMDLKISADHTRLVGRVEQGSRCRCWDDARPLSRSSEDLNFAGVAP